MNMFKGVKQKTPAAYIQSLPAAVKTDVEKLHQLILKYIPKWEVKMWGSMIGYGAYHYKYASGREGDWMPLALSARKNYISFYSCLTDGKQYIAEKYKKDLPKASIGKSCVRFKKLADVDEKTLVKIIKETVRVAKK